MKPVGNILVLQTAFLGDVILTIPVAQALREQYPDEKISFVVTPLASGVLANHPAIDEVIDYDKRGGDSGVAGLFRVVRRLRRRQFDIAIVPHRSLRSALTVWLAGIPRRIGFTRSAGRVLFTDVVRYESEAHEVTRNLSLLEPLGSFPQTQTPRLHPSSGDKEVVDEFLQRHGFLESLPLIALAPGSVWTTKRWPPDHYATLGKMLVEEGHPLVLIGGKGDTRLCSEIEASIGSKHVLNAAGKLSLLQSAELLRRCRLVVSNDSAPVHLAVGIGTPVVAIFGPTVPRFGFAPMGKNDVVVGMEGLECRPCSIHGGKECPIKTFVCMKELTPQRVHSVLSPLLHDVKSEVWKSE